jgi:hypothetical protein
MRGAKPRISVLCISLGCVLLALGRFSVGYVPAPSVVNHKTSDPRETAKDTSAVTAARPVSNLHLPVKNFSAFRHASKVYPYSIIPGGIESVTQLRKAIALDPVVAAHYAAFNLAKARLIRLNHERTAYVSYRRDDKAYWTTRKLLLHAGEAVVTDGRHMARARCGNLISDVPLSPVSLGEPTPSTLDTPLTLDSPLMTHASLTLDDPMGPGWVASFAPQQSMDSSDPGHDMFIPLVPFLFIPTGSPSTPPLPPNPVPPVPPVSVSEPSTLLLLFTGLSSAWLVRKTSARREP